LPSLPGVGYSEEIDKIEARLEALRDLQPSGAAWKTVELARHQERPQTLDYVEHLFPDFQELHGDRLHGDDPAVVGGMATLDGKTIMLIGHQKGHDLKERQFRNFGMPRPEGYRKAQRLALLADKFQMPVVTLVDTQGAFPGREAEERGQAQAISHSLQVFARLLVPTVAVIIGEGGSGGALALALCDRVYMLEHSIYSVITPEGCAAILWRDAAEAPQAAEALRLSAADLLSFGVIDGIIREPGKGAHRHHGAVAKRVLRQIQAALAETGALKPEARRDARLARYLSMGRFAEAKV
jgi:acetyl-CoA carboxylase carboxyl transferase subunit alpha